MPRKPTRRTSPGARRARPELLPGKAPAPELPTGAAFRPEWVDFERGLRVGNLEPHERITQILRYRLEQRHGTRFITDRWGRGAFWQWICWLPRANREAKPESSGVNFGCAKLFITADREARVFKSGLQIERGYARGPEPYPGCLLAPDWDWQRLIKQCAAGTALDRELGRLLRREGFVVELGGWVASATFAGDDFRSAAQIREAARRASQQEWVAFQLYYPMPEAELRAAGGLELVDAIAAVFAEVTPVMNLCMQIELKEGAKATGAIAGRR